MRERLKWVISASLFMGTIYHQLPVTEIFFIIKPDLLILLVMFWALYYPNRFGVRSGFLLGLLQDILGGTLLGEQALLFTLVSYVCNQMRHRVQMYPNFQKTLTVGLLFLFLYMINFILQWLVGHALPGIGYWVPVITSTIVWPILVRFLNSLIRVWVLRQGPVGLSTI